MIDGNLFGGEIGLREFQVVRKERVKEIDVVRKLFGRDIVFVGGWR